MQENVAISMKNSIKKGNPEHCLETRLLPPFPGAQTWLERFASILLNHPGRWIQLVLPRGAGSLFLAEVYLQGEILETNLARTDFGLGSLKPRCKQRKKRLVRKDVFNSVHLPVGAGERGQIKNSIGNRWEVWLRRDPPPC